MASIICGFCRETHESVGAVRSCYDERAEQEAAYAAERYAEDAWLRAGEYDPAAAGEMAREAEGAWLICGDPAAADEVLARISGSVLEPEAGR